MITANHASGRVGEPEDVGRAACNAEGEYWRTQGATSWACNLNDPDASVYNLWLTEIYG
jgi:hypothetical protein